MINDQVSAICTYLDCASCFKDTLIAMVDAPSLVSHSKNNKDGHFCEGVYILPFSDCQTV